MKMTPEEFAAKLPDLYPLTGEPEFSFLTFRAGPPAVWRVFRDHGKWHAETKVVGVTGGVYTVAEEVDLLELVRKYWADITAQYKRNGGTLWPLPSLGAELVGVKEAAAILGWDKRRISVYRKRGSFPAPIQELASGPVWLRSQIEAYRLEKEEEAE